MPSVPIEIPSLTPIVLKRMPTRSAATTPCLTFSAKPFRCMLQVFPSYHTLQMPTWALAISSDDNPVPKSIACEAPWLLGCVIRRLYLLSSWGMPARSLADVADRYRSTDGCNRL